MECVEKLLGADSRPLAHAHTEAAAECAPVIRQQVTLVDHTDLRLERTALHARPQLRGGIAKDYRFATLVAATPSWGERNHCSVLGDQRGRDAEAALNGREFDERATRRKDELGMWIHSLHIAGGDGQSVVRIQKRSIDVAEECNSR